MKTYNYLLLLNTEHFARYHKWLPGIQMLPTYAGTVTIDDNEPHIITTQENNPFYVCEQIFERHNADNRPNGAVHPSMSVGDAVIIWHEDEAPQFYWCASNGWEHVVPLPELGERAWQIANAMNHIRGRKYG